MKKPNRLFLTPASLCLSLTLLLGCAYTSKRRAQFSDDQSTFKDPDYNVIFQLPDMEGWGADVPKTVGGDNIIFRATHVGQLLDVALSAEPLNSDLEDYFLLIKNINNIDLKPGYKILGKEEVNLNGWRAIRFIYSENIPVQGDADDTLGTRAYIFINYFIKRKEMNFWLAISTLEEAYDRKKPLIEEIAGGLKIEKE